MAIDRATGLLLVGLCGGIVAAAVSLVGRPITELPEDAVALVGARAITQDDWLRAIAAVQADRRTPLTEADQRRILERLVDEELLVQHGLRLGLLEQDRRLRGQLVADVIAAATGGMPEPDEAALRAHYDQHRDYFSQPGRVRVAARRTDGAPLSPAVPDTLLPPAKLREYVGPQLLAVALALPPGERSAPLRHAGQDVVLEVVQREGVQTPPFEDVRDAVREAVLRASEEAALRALLADLREATPPVTRE